DAEPSFAYHRFHFIIANEWCGRFARARGGRKRGSASRSRRASERAMIDRITHLFVVGWRSAFEIVLLSVVIYYGYLYFRGTRGAKVLTGLAIVFLALTLITTLLKLAVIGWILRSFSVFLAIALVVIFQPELRRAVAELGGHPIFSLTSEKREMVHDLAEAVTQLSAKQFGALIAIERDTSIRVYEETGVQLEADFSVELLL